MKMSEHKITILLDVDGVLANTSKAAKELIEGLGGVYMPTAWDFGMYRNTEEIRKQFWALFGGEDSDPGESFCSSLETYGDAKQFVLACARLGSVVYATSPMHTRSWAEDRALWLIEQMKADRKQIVSCGDKSHVRGDVLLDDKTQNVIDWAAKNPDGLGLILAQPYNKGDLRPSNLPIVYVESLWQAYGEIHRFAERKQELRLPLSYYGVAE